MIDLRRAIRAKLIENPVIVANISTFSGAPSIFTVEPIPSDVQLPYMIVSNVSEVPFDTKTEDGREVLTDIRVYSQANGNVSLMDLLVDEIYGTFHNQIIAASGYENVITRVREITVLDEIDVYGRVVTINSKFLKK